MAQTKSDIQALLAVAGLRPQHRYGQNFLIDLNLMRLLVDAAAPTAADVVLEVGCGTGSLTSLLAERAGAVVTVEVDTALAQVAGRLCAAMPNVTLLTTDVLAGKHRIAPAVLDAVWAAQKRLSGRFLLVANLPYQVAAPLIINLLMLPQIPEAMFVTVQVEVAERMAAAPGTKAYGLLSILLQAVGAVRILRRVPPKAFWPPPQVTSALVAWQRCEAAAAQPAELPALKRVVDALLGTRRKKITTCLARQPGGDALVAKLPDLSIDPNARGETLCVTDFVAVARAWAAL